MKVPDSEIVAPLVMSVMTTLEYETLTSVVVCPGGQLKPSESAVGTATVRLPTRFPFWSTGKLPVADTGFWVVVLFEADGFLDPPFTHSYVTVVFVVTVIVSVDPAARPASLNVTTRLEPLSDAEVAFLMKCAEPAANAGVATSASPAVSATVTNSFRISFPP